MPPNVGSPEPARGRGTALPPTLNRSLQATATIAVAELYSEGKSAANDPEEWPLAQISERLDGRTCKLCKAVDGKILKVGTREYAEWRRPSHINCRRVLVYISKDERGAKADFETPDAELIRKHGHYHLRPDRHAALRIPAEPAGRHVIMRRVRNPLTGERRTVLDWAPWHDQHSAATKRLILKARATEDAGELAKIFQQLGLTDLEDAEQLRRATLLGLRDRAEGFLPDDGDGGNPAPTTPAPVAPKPAAGAKLKPNGPPVSGALDVPRARKEWQQALRLLDGVHGDGNLTRIRVKASRSTKNRGVYSYYRNGRAGEIAITRPGLHEELTLLHETGHFLDHQAVGPAGSFASESEPKLQEWRDAVAKSQAVKDLQALLKQATVTVQDTQGRQRTYPVEHRIVRYMLAHRELWARSYAQYIATRSGNADLQNQVEYIRSGGEHPVYTAKQWQDADFEPIAAAIDKLFEALGWLKK